ncbi:hypothetical protein MLD38_014322 [Melastoma candidum]|uniref:Uncharacterized protein n=1 Tax=Melastoma candidum TaxID=119954 RepID=A0ACB9RBS3_9MYRT|nr:hypothetical protein MLD38_014322 [Melastoma candidum]
MPLSSPTLALIARSSILRAIRPRAMSAAAAVSPSTREPISPATTRIGWIGTGVMGRSMCGHLINAGYAVSIFTRTPSKAEPLLSLSSANPAVLSPSPADLAASCHVVFSIVGFPSDVRSVLLTGALPSLRPGSILVDMTTSDPSLAAEIASAAFKKGCHSVDAPVSGGDLGARNATLSIFAGGDSAVVSHLSPLFALMGKVYYMGGPGNGQFAKLANQITIATTMVGLVEGMLFAHKAGLEVPKFLDAIRGGAAGSRSLELYGGRILKRDMEAGFFVEHFVKDLGICLKECERMGLGLPGLALAQQLYLSLMAHGEGRLGTQALILAIERINNISLENTAPPSS